MYGTCVSLVLIIVEQHVAELLEALAYRVNVGKVFVDYFTVWIVVCGGEKRVELCTCIIDLTLFSILSDLPFLMDMCIRSPSSHEHSSMGSSIRD